MQIQPAKTDDFDQTMYQLSDWTTFHFKVRPLTLNVEGSKFAISPQTPSKFTLTCWSDPQDVVVEVHSAMFKIVAPRRSKGITTQDFHRLERSKSMTFEIAFRDLNNFSLDNIKDMNLASPEGYINIIQMNSTISNDSDEAWYAYKDKTKLVQMSRGVCNKYARWKEKLSAETETEDVKRVRKMFTAALLKKFQEAQAEVDKKDRAEKKMYTSPEDLQKVEDEKKAKEEARKAAEEAEREAWKQKNAQNKRDDAMKKWVDKKNKKKTKKKCVIL